MISSSQALPIYSTCVAATLISTIYATFISNKVKFSVTASVSSWSKLCFTSNKNKYIAKLRNVVYLCYIWWNKRMIKRTDLMFPFLWKFNLKKVQIIVFKLNGIIRCLLTFTLIKHPAAKKGRSIFSTWPNIVHCNFLFWSCHYVWILPNIT